MIENTYVAFAKQNLGEKHGSEDEKKNSFLCRLISDKTYLCVCFSVEIILD